MISKFVTFALAFLLPLAAFSDGEIRFFTKKNFPQLKKGKSYVEIGFLPSDVGRSTKGVPVKLFKNKKLDGEAVVEINFTGVFHKGKEICHWENEAYGDPKNPAQTRITERGVHMPTHSIISCDTDFPIISGYTFSGPVHIFIVAKLINKQKRLMEVDYKKEKLYFKYIQGRLY